jgi:tetratricopeptide (TPR) repeat protein
MKHQSNNPEDNVQDPIKIFYCYASGDKSLRDKLASHLESIRRRGLIVPWYDQDITAGKEWLRETYLHLDSSDIVLALISPSFMNSTYCTDIIMQYARERQLIGSIRIIPVILRYVSWTQTFLGELQFLPRNGKPITDWRPIDRGYYEVAKEIEDVVHELRKSKTLYDQKASQQALERGIDLFDLADKNPDYYKESFEYFQQSLRLDQENLEAWAGLAYTLIQIGKLLDALIACNHYLQHDPETDILTLVVLKYKYHILLTQEYGTEAESVREIIDNLPSSLQLEKRFVGFFSDDDREEELFRKGTVWHLPRLSRDDKQQISISSTSTHFMHSTDENTTSPTLEGS